MARDGKRRIVVEFLGEDRNLSQTARGVEGTTSKLGSRLKKVGLIAGAGLAVGVGLAAKGLYEMGKAAAEDAQGQARLAKALENNAGATRGQVKATEDWITAQGKALGVADDQLRPALANLVRSTHNVGKAQKLASLAMDISAGTGKDLGAVSMALAKAQNGNVSALARLGVNVKDAEGKTVSFETAQKRLAKTFGGSAKANAETFGGRMRRLRLMFDEAKESIGAKLLPVAERLAAWFFTKGIPAVQQFTAFLQTKLGPVFENIRGIIQRATGGMNGDVSKNLGAIRSTFQSIVSIITSLWNRFGGTLTEFAVKTFGNLRTVIGGALQIVSGIFKVFAALLKGDWSGAWDGIKQIASGAMAVIRGSISQFLNLVKTLFRVAWSAIKGIVGGAWDGIKSLIASGAANIANSVRAIPGKLKALGGVFKEAGHFLIQQMVDGLKNAAGVIEGIAGNVWNAIKGLLNGAIDKINNALEFGIHKGPVNISVNPPDIPHLARGGVVRARRGGTLALLGEGGADEAVVPLSGPYAPRSLAAGSSGTLVAQAPLLIQMDGRTVWQGLLNLKRGLGGIELGLA